MRVKIVGVKGDAATEKGLALVRPADTLTQELLDDAEAARERASEVAGRGVRMLPHFFVGDPPPEARRWPQERSGGAKFFQTYINRNPGGPKPARTKKQPEKPRSVVKGIVDALSVRSSAAVDRANNLLVTVSSMVERGETEIGPAFPDAPDVEDLLNALQLSIGTRMDLADAARTRAKGSRENERAAVEATAEIRKMADALETELGEVKERASSLAFELSQERNKLGQAETFVQRLVDRTEVVTDALDGEDLDLAAGDAKSAFVLAQRLRDVFVVPRAPAE